LTDWFTAEDSWAEGMKKKRVAESHATGNAKEEPFDPRLLTQLNSELLPKKKRNAAKDIAEV